MDCNLWGRPGHTREKYGVAAGPTGETGRDRKLRHAPCRKAVLIRRPANPVKGEGHGPRGRGLTSPFLRG